MQFKHQVILTFALEYVSLSWINFNIATQLCCKFLEAHKEQLWGPSKDLKGYFSLTLVPAVSVLSQQIFPLS